MTNWRQYFETDWQAMTATDWAGVVLSVIIFVALSVIFYWVLRPSNKQRLESYRHLPFEEADSPIEVGDDR